MVQKFQRGFLNETFRRSTGLVNYNLELVLKPFLGKSIFTFGRTKGYNSVYSQRIHFQR